MAEIPYFVRYKDATTIADTDSLYFDVVGTDVPNKVTYSDVVAVLALRTFVQVSATYTVLITDYTVECTANSFTVTLPTAVGIEGKVFNIANSGAGIITLEGDGSETIQGDLNQTIYKDESFQVQSNGTNYIII